MIHLAVHRPALPTVARTACVYASTGATRPPAPRAAALAPLGLAAVLAVVVGFAVAGGCARTAGYAGSPYSESGDIQRDAAAAEALARRAAELLTSDAATDHTEAESLLRQALALDLYNGPAHNNLGTILLARGDLYAAANEFEWAKKLLPGHPDPRINLALTLERAGRADEAVASYDAALDVYPNHLGATQGLVRLQLRSGRPDDRTHALLREVALRGENEAWRSWAARHAALRAAGP